MYFFMSIRIKCFSCGTKSGVPQKRLQVRNGHVRLELPIQGQMTSAFAGSLSSIRFLSSSSSSIRHRPPGDALRPPLCMYGSEKSTTPNTSITAFGEVSNTAPHTVEIVPPAESPAMTLGPAQRRGQYRRELLSTHAYASLQSS